MKPRISDEGLIEINKLFNYYQIFQEKNFEKILLP